MTKKKNGGQKAGLKLSLGYILKKTKKVVLGYYTQKTLLDKAAEVERFASVLELNWDFIFYSAEMQCEQQRNALRRPQDMPLEEDIENLKILISTKMSAALKDLYRFWGNHEFVSMRNLIVSRLTMFNARRGGERTRMTLSEWEDAEKGRWVDPDLVLRVDDPLEKDLIDHFKLAYQACARSDPK